MYVNPRTQDYFDVENLALRFYSTHQGLNGMHCENSLGKTLFGLLMWNIIFDDTVPYVFQSPYQSRPLDFETKHFYLNRKAKADARLAEIGSFSAEEIKSEIAQQWKENEGKFNDFVAWNSSRLTLKKLQLIASLLGGKPLAAILKNYTT